MAAQPGALPRADVLLEHDRLPGAAPRDPRAPGRRRPRRAPRTRSTAPRSRSGARSSRCSRTTSARTARSRCRSASWSSARPRRSGRRRACAARRRPRGWRRVARGRRRRRRSGASSASAEPPRRRARLTRAPRQLDHELRAAAGGVRGADAAAVRVDDRGDDREAEPGAGAAALAAALGAPEALEDARRRRPSGRPGPWSRTTIRTVPSAPASDSSIGVPAGVWVSALRIRLASTWRSCDGVAADDGGAGRRSPSRRGRGRRRARRRRRRAAAARGRPARARVCGISSRRASASRSSTSTPIRAASSSIRAIAFAMSCGLRRGAHAEQLGVAADRGQRRAQLVRGVGEEAAQAVLARLALAEGVLDLAEHRVEREAEAADLGARVRRADAAREVAGGDRAGGRADAVERPQAEADQQPGEARRARATTARDHDQLDVAQARERLRDVAAAGRR